MVNLSVLFHVDGCDIRRRMRVEQLTTIASSSTNRYYNRFDICSVTTTSWTSAPQFGFFTISIFRRVTIETWEAGLVLGSYLYLENYFELANARVSHTACVQNCVKCTEGSLLDRHMMTASLSAIPNVKSSWNVRPTKLIGKICVQTNYGYLLGLHHFNPTL